MSKKRSAREAFAGTHIDAKSPSPADVWHTASGNKPLSAFAAAKAAASQSAGNELATKFDDDGDDRQRHGAELLVRSLDISGRANDSLATTTAGQETNENGVDVAFMSEEDISNDDTIVQLLSKRQLSSFRPGAVISNATQVSIELEIDESAVLLGIYDLELKKGTVVVNGALLRPGTGRHRIFAPATHALPVIEAKSGAAEITIYTVAEHPLQGLETLSPLWSKTWHDNLGQQEPKSFCLLYNSTDDPLKRPVLTLGIDMESQQIINKIMSQKPDSPNVPSTIMVTGSKGSGKSTFCRTLVNTLLTAPQPWTKSSCFWLDLDPGQPEFGPTGQVSLLQIREPLLGPAYTHVFAHLSSGRRCIRAHTLAAITPKEDSNHFLECAKDLLEHCKAQQKDFQKSPLIINCSGWTAGSASAVLMQLINGALPNHLVLTTPLDSSLMSTLKAAISPKLAVYNLPGRARTPQTRTSAELRAMQTMSYMHSLAPRQGHQTWTHQPLTTLPPWRVPYSTESGLSAILSYHDEIDPSMLSIILPGTMVSIVALSSPEALNPRFRNKYLKPHRPSLNPRRPLSERIQLTKEALPFLPPQSASGAATPLDPRHSETLAQALVRGIDVENKELVLLSPVSLAVVQRHIVRGEKIVLVRGKFDFPDWALLEDVHYQNSLRVREDVEGVVDEDIDSSEDDDHDGGGNVVQRPKIERPYVSVRRPEAGIGGSVWRVRHLPRRL